MRVLHVIAEMRSGGAESLVVQMCRSGAELGWVSAVASSGGFHAEALADEDVATFHVPLAERRSIGVLRATGAVRAAIRSFRPDAIMAHNVSATGITRLAKPRRGRVLVVSVFHGVAAADYRASARVLDLGGTHVVTVSNAIARRLAQAGLKRKPVIIPNAVAVPEAGDKAAARRALGLPLDVPIALCLARMVEQKRHDVLLDAWAQTPGEKLLLLAGDGPLRPELEAQAAGRLDVRFLGVRRDIPDLLTACDFTVLSSDWEGLPIAALESLAAARPLAASDVDGIREACAPGALLVPPRHPELLAEAMATLLTDDEQRRKLGEAGREHVIANYSLSTMMRAYDALLRDNGGRRR